MLTQLTIPKRQKGQPAFDHRQFFQLGLDHVRRLSSRIWTDHNIHDPGITTLELLCYALTDLSYRASLPVQDLLAPGTEDGAAMREQFPTAARILPNRPLTGNDYRKLLIDLPGVRNAWIEAEPLSYWADRSAGEMLSRDPDRPGVEAVQIAGLYRVIVDYEEGYDKEVVTAAVMERLQANRNLCEDFVIVTEVGVRKFDLCCQVELAPEADPARVDAEIRLGIEHYLDPPVRSYSLSAMLERTRPDGSHFPVEELFDGPLLANGFIDNSELEKALLRKDIRLSDMVNIIMDIQGVRAVREITVTQAGLGRTAAGKQWLLKLDDWTKAVLNQRHLVYFKRNIPVPVKADEAERNYRTLAAKALAQVETERLADLPIPTGTVHDTADYYSFQNHFPALYGLSQYGLPGTADDRRRGLALQLKGYLLFFDQIMADYMAQLSRVKELFSLDPDLERTYFHQVVDSFRDHESVYGVKQRLDRIPVGEGQEEGIAAAVGFFTAGAAEDVAERAETLIRRYLDSSFSDGDSLKRLTLLAIEHRADEKGLHIDRRNRFLDHLIARFAERFHEFAQIMYVDFGAGAAEMIRHKCEFLRNYPETSGARGLAYNQVAQKPEDLWDSWNVSGFERRLASLLGIRNYRRRNLADMAFELYPEVDKTPGDEYRFRICSRDTGRILLSSTVRYRNQDQADDAMRRAIVYGQIRSYYRLEQTKKGEERHYFNLVDEAGKVVARRIEYFTTVEAAEKAIADTIDYLSAHFSGEGVYVIENILLRPRQEGDPFFPICRTVDGGTGSDSDPYSYRLHILIPAYGGRFGKMEFRQYAEEVIRSETPAHILPKICWLDNDDISLVEEAYREWLELGTKRDQSERARIMTRLIYALVHGRNVYPTRKMEGCGPVTEENTFVLNSTRLGSSKKKPFRD